MRGLKGVDRMIRIDKILDASRILTDLKSGSKPEVLRAMTDWLASQKMLKDSAAIHQLLLDRETLMTTGVKNGFAFPHCFSEEFDESFLTLGIVPDGVDYESLDGNPVEYIFLLLGPPHHQTVHLRILARISRLMSQPDMLETLRSLKSSEEIMQLFVDTERRLTSLSYYTSDV